MTVWMLVLWSVMITFSLTGVVVVGGRWGMCPRRQVSGSWSNGGCGVLWLLEIRRRRVFCISTNMGVKYSEVYLSVTNMKQ